MDQSMYNLNEDFKQTAETLLEKSFRRKVFFTVAIAHIVFIIGPFIFLGLWEKLNDRKPPPMLVDISNIVPGGIKTDEPPGKPNTPKNDNKESKKVEKKEPPAEEEQIAEEPPPKPAKKEVPVVEPVKEAVKVPVEKKAPEIKTTEKKVETTKTVEPKKTKEIKTSTEVVKVKNPPATTPKISGPSLAAKLKKIQDSIKDTNNVGESGAGAPGPIGGIGVQNGVGVVPSGYYETVSMYIYDLWKQPGKAELKGMKPVVKIHISIDSSGNIKSATIVTKSNNQPMDSSVEELLPKLKKLPSPPQGALELDVSLVIDENS